MPGTEPQTDERTSDDTADDAVGFALTVPQDWFEIELRPSVREASITALVHQQVPRGSALHEARAGIKKLLIDYSAQAWAAGAAYCACFVRPTDEGPITGSVAVLIVDPPLAGPVSVDAVLDALAAAEPERVPVVAAIEGIGQGARLYGTEEIELPDGRLAEAVVMQTFIPIPGATRFAVVSASSPVLWLEEVLLDLFDAVTGTFRFVF